MAQHADNQGRGADKDPITEINRLNRLVHELNGLLDGSMRSLSIAQRVLSESPELAERTREAQHRIDVAREAMDRMAELVNAAACGAAVSIGSRTLGVVRPVSVAQAVRHAVEVCSPAAAEQCVQVECSVAAELEQVPAEQLYVVVLNGIRNALAAIARREGPGLIEVRARVEGFLLVLEVADDGAGLASELDAARMFEAGVSSEGPGRGLGLSVCAGVAEALGGTIELMGPGLAGRGAMLRLTCPLPGGTTPGEGGPGQMWLGRREPGGEQGREGEAGGGC